MAVTGVLFAPASGVLTGTGVGTSGQALTSNGASTPSFATLGIAGGGTGATTLTAHSVLVGNGTSAITQIAVGSTGQLLVGASAADPAFGSSATGDFTFTSSTAGATRTFTTSNTNNSDAASTALIKAVTGGASAGDAYYQASTTTTTWSFGVDNSVTSPAADPFVIAASSTLGTTNVLSASTGGQINLPLQSSFLAALTTTVNDVTGDSTVYTIIFDTEIFDQNNDFNLATSTFTAPVTGRYTQSVSALLTGGTAITSARIQVVTSNASYMNTLPLTPSVTTSCSGLVSILTDMDAGDTCTYTVTTADGGGKVDDITGNASGSYRTYASAVLNC